MTTRCAFDDCNAPTGGLSLCHDHTRQMRRQLARLPELHDELRITEQRRDNTGPRTEVHANDPAQPLIYAEAAARHRQNMIGALANIVSLLYERRCLPVHPHLSCQLIRTAPKPPEQRPDGATIASVINSLHARALQIIDLPTISARYPLGPCPELDDTGEHCAGTIWAWISADQDKPAILQCNTCEHQWPGNMRGWADVLTRITGEQQRLTQAAQLASTIIRRGTPQT